MLKCQSWSKIRCQRVTSKREACLNGLFSDESVAFDDPSGQSLLIYTRKR